MHEKPIVAVAAACLGWGLLLTACSTDGAAVADDAAPTTAADTTSPTVESSLPSAPPESSAPTPPTTTPFTPAVPAPANSQTMLCSEYLGLDKDTQAAVIVANGVTKNPLLNVVLVGLLCRQDPTKTVHDTIGGMKDEIIHN